MHDSVTCIDYLENMDSLSYADLTNSDTFHYTISKITFINSTTNLIRKIVKYWEGGKPW